MVNLVSYWVEDNDKIRVSHDEEKENICIRFGDVEPVKFWIPSEKIIELIELLQKEKAALLGATIQNKLKANFITKAAKAQ